MAGQLQDKVAIVTGGANGIGEAVARCFSSQGAIIVIADIQDAAGQKLAKELPRAHFLRTDVSQERDVASAVDFAGERFGRLDVMVNNAGAIGATGSIANLSGESWRSTLALLLDSAFYGIKHAARVMIPKQQGRILCTASTAALASGLGAHAYTAAKHGLIGLVKSASVELAAHRICVNAVAPGSTVTPLAVSYYGSEEKALEECARESPLSRAIIPEDIAQAFLFLAADSGRVITGHTLLVDAGTLAVGNGSARRFYSP